jgi:asparagine synthase (glutamine-hydrolysing)
MQMRVATRFERLCAQAGLAYADPWSDQRLVEFALAVPQRALSRAGNNKRLARTAMRGIMPEAARQRAGKTSPKPLYERALNERAQETVWGLLTNTRASADGYIDEDALRTYYERYLQGEAEDHRFWYALTLEMWLRQHERSVRESDRTDQTRSRAVM